MRYLSSTGLAKISSKRIDGGVVSSNLKIFVEHYMRNLAVEGLVPYPPLVLPGEDCLIEVFKFFRWKIRHSSWSYYMTDYYYRSPQVNEEKNSHARTLIFSTECSLDTNESIVSCVHISFNNTISYLLLYDACSPEIADILNVSTCKMRYK